MEVLRSRGLIEKLVNRLDLTRYHEFNRKLRPEFRFSIGAIIKMVRGVPEDTAAEHERREIDSVIDSVLDKISVSNVRQSYVFVITTTTEDAEKSANIANALAEL